MNTMRSSAEKAAFDGLLLAVSLILSYVESLLPLGAFSVPGFKLGFANICVMLAVFEIGIFHGAAVSLLRVVLSSILFGTPVSFLYSLSGALFSLIFMIIVKKFFDQKFGYVGISVASAALHNIGQVFAAFVMFGFEKSVFIFLEWLLPISLVTGVITGFLAFLVSEKLGKVVKK